MHDARRYFIVNCGRSGSSLLCVVMADAGADFGMPAPPSWDPRHGVMEDADIKRAAHHMRRAHDCDLGRRFVISPQIEAKLRRRRARTCLARALERARCVKIGDLDLLVQQAFALGYEPRVIVNYRRFADELASTLVGRKHLGPDQIAADYLRTCRQGLALMHTFGGCAIGFEEMLGADGREWLTALAAAADLDRQRLAAAAAQRIAVRAPAAAAAPVLYRACDEAFDDLRACAGRTFAPSAPVARALDARQSAHGAN